MTWDELKDLHLKVARAVGAERELRIEPAEPAERQDAAFEFTPTTVMPRWGFFRRRPQLREPVLIFIAQKTQHAILPNWEVGELERIGQTQPCRLSTRA